MENVNVWLSETPDISLISPAPSGGIHIAIETLEGLLDDCTTFNWSTANFKPGLYTDHNGELHCYGSIDLILNYKMDGIDITRRFCGAANFKVIAILPNIDWCATLKSYCVKNAASDAGKKLGRDLNKTEPESKIKNTLASLPKLKG